jgi:thermitase
MTHHRRSLAMIAVVALVLALLAGCAAAPRSGPPTTAGPPTVPAGPGFWGLVTIHAADAWTRVPDASTAVIAVVDSGQAAKHPDLPPPQLLPNHNVCPSGTTDVDEDGHGTMVAGVLAARATATRARGVAPGAQLRPYKFLCPSGFLQTRAVDALSFAVTTSPPPDVVNASWAALPDDAAQAARVDAIVQVHAHILFVFAAPPGNGPYPAFASRPNVLIVTASDSDDTIPRWAGRDAQAVHLAAPGVGIATTDIPDTWTTFQGASAAAAFVSGCGALVKIASRPLSLTGAKIREYLVENADKVGALDTGVLDGRRLNCGKAVNAVPR